MISERYSRNIGAVTEDEMHLLKNCRILIAGCGGLGGNLLNYFLRIGIGFITVVDGDSFDSSNLNRQFLCTKETLGHSKVQIASKAGKSINPDVQISSVHTHLNASNCSELIQGHDLVLDALDNIESRKILAESCQQSGIPLIYGAIRGWVAQISLLLPETAVHTVDILYPPASVLQDKSCLAFTPAVCAGIQAAEAVKFLLGKPSLLQKNILYMDLLNNEFELIPLY